MQIVGFGTYDRRKHPRVGILLDGLATLGVETTELNAPLGFSTAERVAQLNRPWLGYRLILRLLRRWANLTGQRLRLGRRRPDAVLVGYLGHFDVILARLLFPRTPIALDLLIFAADTARDRGTTGGLKLRLLGGLDRIAISCADLVIVDTEQHLELIPAAQRHKGLVAAVGAPSDWFAEEIAESPTGPLRIVFFGLFTPLQGAPVIGAALASLEADVPIEVTMIGSGQELVRTRELVGTDPRISWREWVEPEELKALLRSHELCLGIFSQTPKGLRVVPNKVYQGAASGCAILTSGSVPQQAAFADAARFVPPSDPAALAAEIRSLAQDRDEVRRLRIVAQQRAQQCFRPEIVAAPVLAALVRASEER